MLNYTRERLEKTLSHLRHHEHHQSQTGGYRAAVEDLLALHKLLDACAAVGWDEVLDDVREERRLDALSRGTLDEFPKDDLKVLGIPELRTIRDLVQELRPTEGDAEAKKGSET